VWKHTRKQFLLLLFFSFFCFSLLLAIYRNLSPGGDLFAEINAFTIFFALTMLLIAFSSKAMSFENVAVLFLATVLFFTIHQTTLLNVDRSRSYFIIGWVHNQRISIDDGSPNYERVLSMEKLNPWAMTDRLEEQISRGYILNEGKTLRLSARGQALYSFAQYLSKVYSLTNWDLNRS
jgi:hypothetical protein